MIEEAFKGYEEELCKGDKVAASGSCSGGG